MEIPSFKVMNNNDLRGIIFSYFRKHPEIICCTCNKVCVWNKKEVRRYTSYPILDATVIINQCFECYFPLRDWF